MSVFRLGRLALVAAMLGVVFGPSWSRGLAALPPPAAADEIGPVPSPDSLATADDSEDEPLDVATPPPAPVQRRGLEPLVPELAGATYRMSPGLRPYRNRLAFSPGYGSLGAHPLFTFRLAYSPNEWLGYEGSIDHNPAQSVHAVQHSLSAILRHPFAGRFQPYAALGYGMFMVFPGNSLNADPVTKNAITAGGGLECFIRDDLALRGDMRRATVFGRQKDQPGVVTYDYLEQSIGLVFYRSIRP